MENMRHQLEEKYNNLFIKYNLEPPLDNQKMNHIIRWSLQVFLENSKKPAIYCNGGHTQMLMADFAYELKNIKYIVDNYAMDKKDSGYIVIKDQEIECENIDAIVLSTFKFRKDVKKKLAENHSNIPVLDIYDEFEKSGINLQSDYYYSSHPYHHYHSINKLQREIKAAEDEKELEKLYIRLITKYIHIKDFRTAIQKMQEMLECCDSEKAQFLKNDLMELYELEKQALEMISENNVLMLCLDALRFKDLSKRYMPKLKKIVDETAFRFETAYSFSTSTFESLLPVYSENSDLHTKYYEKNTVDIENCRFAELAVLQKRKIYVYGDAEHYIEGNNIQYSDGFQTVMEKVWNFLLDSIEDENGLFYIHESYESHFTFSNPYTLEPLKSEGTAMLFDFLPVKGGHLRADYKRQHRDAIRYLDDVLSPVLKKLSCRMVLYADHGTLILDKDSKVSEVGDMEYICSENWTRIPMVVRSPEIGVGKTEELISLMELNHIVVSLLKKEDFMTTSFQKSDYIKIARSKLYNPDFKFLYHMVDKGQYLQAFECFVFKDGYKLIVFEDGKTELYLLQGNVDCLIQNDILKSERWGEIKSKITVCDIEEILK